MIEKILKIDKFGIFENYKWAAELKPFNRFNVMYGWNGSGKTTLARVFRCLEIKSNCEQYPSATYQIELEDGNKISSTDHANNLQLKVFNQDFVRDNLEFFNAQTKAIIFISKEKIDEKKEFDEKTIELLKKKGEIEEKTKLKDEANAKINKCHQDAGKNIKNFLLGTIYANVTYNISSSRDKIWPVIAEKDLSEFILDDAQLQSEKSYTLINSGKNEVTELTAIIDVSNFAEIENQVKNLTQQSVTSVAIDRLKSNPDISDWVMQGLYIYKTHQSSNCEFCGSEVTPERIEELDAHYNEAFTKIIQEADQLIDLLNKSRRIEFTSESHLLYEELVDDYKRSLEELNAQIIFVNNLIDLWISDLNDKKANPFKTVYSVSTSDETISAFNNCIKNVNKIIERHNAMSKSHGQLAERAKLKIEQHFVAELANSEKLKEKFNEVFNLDTTLNALNAIVEAIEERIAWLLGELKNDTLAISEINDFLHKFLGRNDITLERLEEGGYQLRRNGHLAKNLSEGEKTAISLIYFFSKIKEGGIDIKKQIIVLDDPISSFDSNHLFNASSFIKNLVNDAQQVFVLTHNFWFFKQVRDWMLKKNKKDNEVTHIYNVERGLIKNANAPLSRFNSEYQYVFNVILDYCVSTDKMDESTSFMIANAVRRLLEGFTNFKTPADNGFDGALQLGIKNGLEVAQKDRIFYFLNKYSHLDRIESFDTTIEVLLDEGKNVVKDVLWLIKKVDSDHYESMLKVASHNDPLLVV